MPSSREDKAAAYRQQARTTRQAAHWLSLKEQRQKLMAEAERLEALAESEDRRAETAASRENPRPEP